MNRTYEELSQAIDDLRVECDKILSDPLVIRQCEIDALYTKIAELSMRIQYFQYS